jgi:hypothetical protein
MVTGDVSGAVADLAVVGTLAVVLFGIGVVALKWKDD